MSLFADLFCYAYLTCSTAALVTGPEPGGEADCGHLRVRVCVVHAHEHTWLYFIKCVMHTTFAMSASLVS